MEYVVYYSSNNSGGDWWLKDDDWHNLEANGWTVDWVRDSEFYNRYSKTERWLGALATKASKTFDAPSERIAIDLAIEDWESITGQNAHALGCSCCGQPHYFDTWGY